jgi:hypothetical protein
MNPGDDYYVTMYADMNPGDDYTTLRTADFIGECHPETAVQDIAPSRASKRDRQRAIYGIPLGEVVFRVTDRLGITQFALARTLGMSPSMLSQVISAERVRIGDPTALARLRVLDRRSVDIMPCDRESVYTLLGQVRAIHWRFP